MSAMKPSRRDFLKMSASLAAAGAAMPMSAKADEAKPGKRCPLYQRDHYRKNKARWRKVARFVSDEDVRY